MILEGVRFCVRLSQIPCRELLIPELVAGVPHNEEGMGFVVREPVCVEETCRWWDGARAR